jgi:hypothetical protein
MLKLLYNRGGINPPKKSNTLDEKTWNRLPDLYEVLESIPDSTTF